MAMPGERTAPYARTGRRRQKARTHDALVAAARAELAEGAEPTVETAAARAGVSRTTAYRYFPTRRALLVAAQPYVDRTTLLPPDAPDDVTARLDIVLREALAIVRDGEPQLRAALRVSLEPGTDPRAPVLRQGRVIGWLEEALAPLAADGVDPRRLAVAIRAATGIEAFVWLVDVAGLTRDDAVDQLLWTGRALLRAALVGGAP
jgi:AcrR family transcriptional regulator